MPQSFCKSLAAGSHNFFFFLPNRPLFFYAFQLMSAPQINISDVASLARLTLTPEETAKFSSQIGQILSHMDSLKQIETGNVPEVTPPAQPNLRKDEPTPSLSLQAVLSNAPAQANDLIVVPKIVE
ncbi:MAG: Asp-tRNA(Asn)/Glu-tRNA(Gln) amidotransferase GatCAB subunit C [Verrucomicrobia bacterium]|nr:Asp-tRNA(Asn)/Glu-tRNA(Gln) amidotransferase GatCAB subunit C [Verrucomicrobiota bacterium]